MTPQALISPEAFDDAPSAAQDLARSVLEEQLAGLRRLAQIGLAICDDIGQQSAEAAGRSPAADHVELRAMKAAGVDLSYARVSRSVRLTYAMQDEVLERLERCGRIEDDRAAEAARLRAEAVEARHGQAARVLTRIIEDEAYGPEAFAEGAPDPAPESESEPSRECETYDRLVREARECLKDRERYDFDPSRPLSEVIAHICRDLGVNPDWLSLSEEAWAREEVRSGMVGEALASFSSPARGGGGPAQPVEGAQRRSQPPPRPPPAPPPRFPGEGRGPS